MIAGVLELQWMTDMVRLSNDMRRAQGVIGGAMGGIERSIAGAQSALAKLGVGFGIHQLVAFANSTVGAVAALDDLAEKTGASVEELSRLSQVATIGGHATETYESALVRLGKAIHGTDEESKGAGKALAALGLSAEQLRGMDTAEALQRVAVELNKYADGSGKSALAMDLLGKSGAQALPFLKDLASEQGISVRVTAEQAAEAERLQKALGRLKNEFDGIAQAMSIRATPALADWLEANREALRIAGGLGEALRLFVFNLDAMTTERPREQINRLTEAMLRYQGASALGKFMQSPTGFLFGGREEDLKKQIDFLKVLERQQAMANARAMGDTEGERHLRGRRQGLATLDYKPDAKDPGDLDAAYRGLLRTLKEKLATDEKIGEVGRLQLQFEAMNAKTLATFTAARREELFDLAKKIDLKNAEKEATDRYIKSFQAEQEERDQQNRELAEYEAGKSRTLLDFDQRIQQAKFENTLLAMNNEQRELAIFLRDMEAAGIQRGTSAWEQYAIAYKQAIGEKATLQAVVESQKTATDEITEFWNEAARSMQRAMSDFFFDAMQGQLGNLGASFKRTIDRMVADQLAAQAATSMFGPNFGKAGGQLGGWVGSGLNMLGIGGGGAPVVDRSVGASAADIARLGGGGSSGGGGFFSGFGSWLSSLIPFETGTPFVPADGPYMLHRGERVVTAADNARGGGSRPVNLTIHYSGGVPVDRRTQEQNAAVLMRQANRAVQRATA